MPAPRLTRAVSNNVLQDVASALRLCHPNRQSRTMPRSKNRSPMFWRTKLIQSITESCQGDDQLARANQGVSFVAQEGA